LPGRQLLKDIYDPLTVSLYGQMGIASVVLVALAVVTVCLTVSSLWTLIRNKLTCAIVK